MLKLNELKQKRAITLVALILTIIVMLILAGVSVSVLINSDLIGTAQNAGDRTETAYGKEGILGGITVGNKNYDSIQDYIDGNGWEVIYEGNTPTTDGQLMITETEVFKGHYKYRITMDGYEEPIECIAILFQAGEGMRGYMLLVIADGEVITFASMEEVATFSADIESNPEKYQSVISVGGINISETGSMIMAEGSELTITKIEEYPVSTCIHKEITLAPNKQATCKDAGEETGYCTNCCEMVTRIIPAGPEHHQYNLEAICTICGYKDKSARVFGTIEVIWLDKNNNVIEEPLEPVVNESYMTPVVWSETESKFVSATEGQEWYDYIAGTGIADNTASKWANVEVKPTSSSTASYFVWIPRYAYRITYYNSSDLSADTTEISGYCDGRGIVDVKGNVKYALDAGIETVSHNGNSYIVHPAFMDDTSSSYSNGGWTEDLAGIWVAKYEMSGTSSVLTSIPDTASLTNLNIANMFNYSKDYASTLKSHLMKNSEWGAVAYLTHSQYGRNGTEVTKNDSGITTAGGDYITNTLQSSTGNVYGIYDLNGTCTEYVAVYNNACDREDTSFGGTTGNTFTSSKPDSGAHYAYELNGASNEYVTAYTNNTSTTYGTKIYEIGKIGDATKEVCIGSAISNWNNDNPLFVYSNGPFFARGGDFTRTTYSGVFYSSGLTGFGNSYDSFRVVCSL